MRYLIRKWYIKLDLFIKSRAIRNKFYIWIGVKV